ncbi:uncharacterized protein LOC143026504 [Oratosquilla oratoria]|uniref:uncharacterized protein LOC143026504 n=1 Tax=Oratosquilla oratoria TaxID=337810 RepID=UPI003F764854
MLVSLMPTLEVVISFTRGRRSTMASLMESLCPGFYEMLLDKPITQEDFICIKKCEKRCDHVHQGKGDVTVALTPLERNLVAEEGTLLARLIHSPGETSVEDARQKACTPLSQIRTFAVERNLLKVFLDHKAVSSMVLKSIITAGNCYGKSDRYKNKVVIMTCENLENTNGNITSYRAQCLLHHLSRLLELCGAEVLVRSLSENNGDRRTEMYRSNLTSNERSESKTEGRSTPDGNERLSEPIGIETDAESHLKFECNLESRIDCGDANVLAMDVSLSSVYDSDSKSLKILCGPVTCQQTGSKLTNYTTQQCCQNIERELERASEDKISNENETHQTAYMHTLARSCVSLILLGVNHLSPVKLSTTQDSYDSRESSFVMYNYARICAILERYTESTNQKLIPILPPIDEVNFINLKHEEEWKLVWVYLHQWPEIVATIVDGIFRCPVGDRKAMHRVGSARVVKFLHGLAHCFSVYYNRIHILPSNVDQCKHLLPQLWARLYLLKGIKIIMESAFRTLDIVPPCYM